MDRSDLTAIVAAILAAGGNENPGSVRIQRAVEAANTLIVEAAKRTPA